MVGLGSSLVPNVRFDPRWSAAPVQVTGRRHVDRASFRCAALVCVMLCIAASEMSRVIIALFLLLLSMCDRPSVYGSQGSCSNLS